MDKAFWKTFEMELRSLDENVQVMNVPLEKQPTSESLEKLRRTLDFKIKKNLQYHVLSLEAARRNVI